MKKKYLYPALVAASMVVLASCGDDESSSALVAKAKTIGSLEVSSDDLAKCTSRAEGSLFVVDEEVQVCEGKKWNVLACGEESVKASVKFEDDSVARILCDGDSVGAITSADVKDCEIAKDSKAIRLLCSGDTLAKISLKKKEDKSSSSTKSSASEDKSSASEDESSSSVKSSASEDKSSASAGTSSVAEDKSSASEDKSSSSVKSSDSEAPVSSSVAPASSADAPVSSSVAPASSAEAPVSSSVAPASSSSTPASSSSLERDEAWAFLDRFVEWRSAEKGRVRSLDADAVKAVLEKNDFVQCAFTSASMLFVKKVNKTDPSAYMIFAASQKDGAKFLEFQVDIVRSLPETIKDQCKESASSSSGKIPFSSSIRPRSSSSEEIILPSSSSIRDSVIFIRSSSGFRDSAIIVLPVSSARIDTLFIRSSSSLLDTAFIRPISSGLRP